MTTITFTGLMVSYDATGEHVISIEDGSVTFVTQRTNSFLNYVSVTGALGALIFFDVGGAQLDTVTFSNSAGEDLGISWQQLVTGYDTYFSDVTWWDGLNENIDTLMWFEDSASHTSFWFDVDADTWPTFSTAAEFETWQDSIINYKYDTPDGVFGAGVDIGYDLFSFASVTQDDVLTGTNGNNGFDEFGNTEPDKGIYGGPGSDHISGLDGHDMLFGGSGDDELYGGNGDDYLYGGTGSDRIFGGNGANILSGDGAYWPDPGPTGSYADEFVFNSLASTNRVDDFEVGIDKLNLAALTGLADTFSVDLNGSVMWRSRCFEYNDISEMKLRLVQNGLHTEISVDYTMASGEDFSSELLITLWNVDLTTLSYDDFIF